MERNLIAKMKMIRTIPMKLQGSFGDRDFDFPKRTLILVFKVFLFGLDQREKIKMKYFFDIGSNNPILKESDITFILKKCIGFQKY